MRVPRYTVDMQLDQVLPVVRAGLQHEPTIAAAWLFGSVARGTAHDRSDVDLAVLRLGASPRRFDDPALEVGDRLARVLGREVQVVELDTAPDDLIHRVLHDGVLLVERDRSRRIAFEVASRNRYFDMVPIWRRYREAKARP
jgi:predicted nucleotidyltransferase